MELLSLWVGYAHVRDPISCTARMLRAMLGAWVLVQIWIIATQYRVGWSAAAVPISPLLWGRSKFGAASVFAVAMGTLSIACVTLLARHPLARMIVPLRYCPPPLATTAIPWRKRSTPALVRALTIYLVLVLLTVVGVATRRGG